MWQQSGDEDDDGEEAWGWQQSQWWGRVRSQHSLIYFLKFQHYSYVFAITHLRGTPVTAGIWRWHGQAESLIKAIISGAGAECGALLYTSITPHYTLTCMFYEIIKNMFAYWNMTKNVGHKNAFLAYNIWMCDKGLLMKTSWWAATVHPIAKI